MLLAEGVKAGIFEGNGGSVEYFITVQGPDNTDWHSQMNAVQDRYVWAQRALSLPPHSAVFRRIFVSDVLNQMVPLAASPLASDCPDNPVAVSIVQQAPLPAAKIALLAYHIAGPGAMTKKRLSKNHVAVDKSGLKYVWSTGLCAGAETPTAPATGQTRRIFEDLTLMLAENGGSLRDHCIRTWIYLKDVDVFYRDMVEARTKHLHLQGLTANTHYIASTGIEGACAHQFDIVAMDAYSILGLQSKQLSFLSAFDSMCATKEYGVTFERATRIRYGDRDHHFISGTASIDRHGLVVHPGNVAAQLDRALENVESLLVTGQASLSDMAYWIVYLRDPSDFYRVQSRMTERFPNTPTVIVHGAVCRPEWLVEVEGVAVSAAKNADIPVF